MLSLQPLSERFSGEIPARSSLITQGDSLVTVTSERVPARRLVQGLVTRIHVSLENLDEEVMGLDGFNWNIERIERGENGAYQVTIFRDLPEEDDGG